MGKKEVFFFFYENEVECLESLNKRSHYQVAVKFSVWGVRGGMQKDFSFRLFYKCKTICSVSL